MAAKNPDRAYLKSENPVVADVCKNCVNCTCGIVAVLQIIAKATAIRPGSEW